MSDLLTIKDLVVDYGGIRALKGISMSVPKGKIIAVLGANGAGKTTTLKAVSGIVPAAGGSVVFDGKDITNKEPFKIARAGIGQSPEGRHILPTLTVEENLLAGSTMLSKKETADMLDEVYQLFPVLKERVKQAATTLSGGEQQMLAIARALMMKPKLLLLDEPSLGLAPLIIKDIMEAIVKISQEGVTVLIVEQNARQSLKIADYAYVMELGKIKMEGISSDLLANDELMSAYLGKTK